MTACAEEARLDDLRVHVRLAHLDAGDLDTQRDGDRSRVVVVVDRVAGLRVAQQMKDRILLRL